MNEQVLPLELISKVNEVFRIYEITQSPEGDQIYIFGDPLVDQFTAYQRLWRIFSRYGYQITLTHRLGENLIVISRARATGDSSINILLAIATFFSTMFMGSTMFGVNPFQDPLNLFKGLPFAIAIMSVLGAHEFGHYIAGKKHGVQTSLPYFIPFPSLIGTLGAVIKQKSPIPDRKILFDIGIAGPLLGIIASIAVTAIGLSLPPVALPKQDAQYIEIGTPLLFEIIASLVSNAELAEQNIMHPVTFAGWVGMIVTVFNLLPVGQLDGGHIMRSIVGRKFKYLSMVVPFLLMIFGIYVLYGMNANGFIWIFWGFFTSLFASAEHPPPLDDAAKLDRKRLFLAVVILILGAMCFTPAPFGSIP
jgi:membrane-associated protease RseP (regulator of RpoE activity)